MATIANQYDPNNPNGANTGGSGTVMPSTGGGAGTPSTGAGTPSGSGSTGGGSATPYQPPNVSQYLAANQGAGQQLSSGITKNVQDQANQVNNNLGQNQNNLDTQYNSLNQNLGAGGQQTIQTAFKDPQALLDSYNAAKTNTTNQPLTDQQQTQAGQYNDFQKLNSGGYNNDIQNYGGQGQQASYDLQNQLGTLTQQTNSVNNEMGRNQLLQNAVGQGNYNQGQQTLDSLFLQNAPGRANAGGLSNIQQLQQNVQGIGNQATQNVNQFGQDTNAKLAALQGLSSSDQSGIKNLFMNGNDQGTGLNQIGTNVANEYASAKTNGAADYNAIQNAFKTNTFSPDQLAKLGLSADQRTWGVDLAQTGGLAQNQLQDYSQGGAAQAANANEFARYNALNQIAGGPNGLQTSIFGGATSAGGFNPINYNSQAAQSAIDAKKGAVLGGDFQTSLSQTENALRNLSHGGFTNNAANNFAGSLAQAQTPQQASQMVANYIQSMQNENGAGHSGITNAVGDYSALNPFRNYYNSEFLPSATGVVGSSYSALPTMNMGDSYNYSGNGPLTYNPIFNSTMPAGAHIPGRSQEQGLIDSATADGSSTYDPSQGAIDWSQITRPQGK